MEHLGLELVVPLWDAPCCCTALLPCCLVPEVLSFESRENGPSFSPATNVNHGQDWTGLKPGTRNPAQVLLAGVGAQAVLCCLPGCACAGSWRWAPAGGTCAAGLHHPLLSSVNEAGLARRRPLAPRGRLGTGDSVSSGRRRAAARWPGAQKHKCGGRKVGHGPGTTRCPGARRGGPLGLTRARPTPTPMDVVRCQLLVPGGPGLADVVRFGLHLGAAALPGQPPCSGLLGLSALHRVCLGQGLVQRGLASHGPGTSV